MKRELYSFDDFKNIMKKLVAPDGCPWDNVQTHESLKRYMIEECYEAIEAINNNDMDNLCEELGDVLLQVVFHAQIAQNNGDFDIDMVVDGVSRKMINRHRHIFSNEIANTAEEVLKNWDEIKKEEKAYKSHTEILRSVPRCLPDLIRAEKVQSKVEKSGFSLGSVDENVAELEEDLRKLKEAITRDTTQEMELIGDILFKTVNISRKLKINTPFVLTNELEKFINRFEYIENMLVSHGRAIEDTSFEEISILWNQSSGITQ